MSLGSDWTNKACLLFLEMYHNEPVLWDPKDSCHKDKKTVYEAWVRISGLMQMSVGDLKRKKDSLMATFRAHLRKKRASEKCSVNSNDVYKPIWFAYDFMEEFLGPVYKGNKTLDTQNIVESVQSNDEDEELLATTSDAASVSSETVTPTVTRQADRYHDKQIGMNPPRTKESRRQIRPTCSQMNHLTTKRSPVEDECDLYSRLLAKKLRKLPENDRDLVMYEIDGIFINRTWNRNRSLSSCTPYSMPSPTVTEILNRSSPSSTSYLDESQPGLKYSRLNVISDAQNIPNIMNEACISINGEDITIKDE